MKLVGATPLVGSDRAAGAAAIASAATDPRTAANVSVSRDGGHLSIGVGAGRGHVVLVGFDPEHRTAIPRGGNAGCTVTESDVVRSARDLGDWTGQPLAPSEPALVGADAAVLLETPGGRIVGAARRRLSGAGPSRRASIVLAVATAVLVLEGALLRGLLLLGFADAA